uniref:Uncharacterized protein n=1 Tax=Biomphalaria glabrata TaxID=6526 RepID=A0A2C9LQ13_BIOGL
MFKNEDWTDSLVLKIVKPLSIAKVFPFVGDLNESEESSCYVTPSEYPTEPLGLSSADNALAEVLLDISSEDTTIESYKSMMDTNESSIFATHQSKVSTDGERMLDSSTAVNSIISFQGGFSSSTPRLTMVDLESMITSLDSEYHKV